LVRAGETVWAFQRSRTPEHISVPSHDRGIRNIQPAFGHHLH
jgi:hypothetical protein